MQLSLMAKPIVAQSILLFVLLSFFTPEKARAIEICRNLSASQKMNLHCYNAEREMLQQLKICKGHKNSLVVSKCSQISGKAHFECENGTKSITPDEKAKLLVMRS